MQTLIALPLGVLFGLGILISGMGNPAKVLNFFDVLGSWDSSLAVVMVAALAVTTTGYQMVFRRGRPLLAGTFNLPDRTSIDAPLLAGAALFGIGWGLSGICPGGLIPVLANGRIEPLVFFAALIAGLGATRFIRTRLVKQRIATSREAPARH